MALNIKDRETDRLARQLSELTGESITDAVKAALRGRLEEERRRRGKKKLDWEKIRAIQDRIASRPVVDDRPHDEMLYDEYGLPK